MHDDRRFFDVTRLLHKRMVAGLGPHFMTSEAILEA